MIVSQVRSVRNPRRRLAAHRRPRLGGVTKDSVTQLSRRRRIHERSHFRRPAPTCRGRRQACPHCGTVTCERTIVTIIGFIGTGHIGTQVARAVTTAGYDVILSNAHDPAPLAAKLGVRARAGTVDEAAAGADLVVVAIPIGAFDSVPVAPLAGKTVIVTSNYNRDRKGAVPALDSGETTVPGLLQAHLPGAHVVRAFSHISSAEITTAGQPGRRTGAPSRSRATTSEPRMPSPRSTTPPASIGSIWMASMRPGAWTAASPRSSPPGPRPAQGQRRPRRPLPQRPLRAEGRTPWPR